MIVRIDTRRITDWDSFHAVFADAFGFFEGYGRNMDAWIDCMSSLDGPEDGFIAVHAPPGGVVTLHLDHADELGQRCPELYDAIVECAAFVNGRRTERGEPAVLALAFHRNRGLDDIIAGKDRLQP